MTIQELDALPVGTLVCWGGWGLIDYGFVTENWQGTVKGIVWVGDEDHSLDLVEVLYGPWERPEQREVNVAHDKLLCGPMSLASEWSYGIGA